MIHRIVQVRLHFLPVCTRVPLKFGHETLTSVTCARVALRVADARGHEVEGWGETPLSVQWVWPSPLPYQERREALKRFCQELVSAWLSFQEPGHALEIGYDFQQQVLPHALRGFNQHNRIPDREPMPWLAALVCNSAFDIALHDAFGELAGIPVYQTYGPEHLRCDLTRFLTQDEGTSVSFAGRYPAHFLAAEPVRQLRAWHLVGGLDVLEPGELTGQEPSDGLPVTLTDWIRRDGLKCLKVKLRGDDAAWDFDRLVRVGRLRVAGDVGGSRPISIAPFVTRPTSIGFWTVAR